MARWIILKNDNGSEYLNLDMATRIIHHERQREYAVEFTNGRITIKQEINPATYAHIAAYIGDIEIVRE